MVIKTYNFYKIIRKTKTKNNYQTKSKTYNKSKNNMITRMKKYININKMKRNFKIKIFKSMQNHQSVKQFKKF